SIPVLAVGLVAASVTLPAVAQDGRATDAFVQSIKTPQFESTISVAPEIMMESGLGSDLVASSIAAGRKLAVTAAEDAEASPEFFGPYLVDERWDVTLANTTFVSVLGTHWMYTGGAHGNTDFSSFIWRRSEGGVGAYMPLADMFADGMGKDSPLWDVLSRTLLAQWEAEWEKRIGQPLGDDDAAWRDGAERAFAYHPEYQPVVTLLPSTQSEKSAGLTFHYSPYLLGPYAMGSFSFDVPYAVFEDYLTDEARSFFGGEIKPAPPADE
ncbi:MAG: DUF3298 domain-containing protein, partial [Pseudomonadota bacterium]